jgi:uncharacterized membrane protein
MLMLRGSKLFHSYRRDFEEGQIAMMLAVVFLALVALIGLVVDGGLMLIYYRIGRMTVDSAAVAAATQMDEVVFDQENDVVLDSGRACDEAQSYAAFNGRGIVSISCSVEDNRATIAGSVEAPTLFLRVFGITSVPFSLSATAELKYGITEEGQ